MASGHSRVADSGASLSNRSPANPLAGAESIRGDHHAPEFAIDHVDARDVHGSHGDGARGWIARCDVKKTILLYGLLGGVLIAVLKLVEYRYLVLEHAIEIYGGLVALIFASLGIWLGLTLTKTKEVVLVKEVPVPVPVRAPVPFVANAERQAQLGITPRELEILGQIAAGLSTREIAEKLFVSENTVKTHSSRLFDKLNAKRRTQAVQVAQEAGLIP